MLQRRLEHGHALPLALLDALCLPRAAASASDVLWINGGYFCLRQEIFEHLHEGEELVLEPFHRLLEQRRLVGLRYEGFWQNMDTFKDRTLLNGMHERGEGPWEIWRQDS